MEASDKMDVIFDMETHDPDDFLTLLVLIDHPKVRLKAVTITPGSPKQVGLVRRLLAQFGLDIPVGAQNIDHPKECVSSWHFKAYGDVAPSREAAPGGQVLLEQCDDDTTLITGAPLKNLGDAMDDPAFRLGRWVAQGGFAGEGVVPAHLQLPKFKGLTTCPTFNFNGAPKAALRALAHEAIGERWLISKNVCHGVIYNHAMHNEIAEACQRRENLALLWHGMDVYLQKYTQPRLNDELLRPDAPEIRLKASDGANLGIMSPEEALARAREDGLDLVEIVPDASPPVCKIMEAPTPSQQGKKFHDPLAACCAIEPAIGTWAEVQMYREKGRWGARLCEGTGTHIIIDYDRDVFLETLTH